MQDTARLAKSSAYPKSRPALGCNSKESVLHMLHLTPDVHVSHGHGHTHLELRKARGPTVILPIIMQQCH